MAYIVGKGTTISVGGTATGQLVSVKPPSQRMETQETTVLSDSWAAFLGTIPDGGDAGFTIRWDSETAAHDSLQTAFVAGAAVAIVITLANSHTIGFSAVITGGDWQSLEVRNHALMNVTMKVTGAITVT